MTTLSSHADNSNPTKICSKCSCELPATTEFFRRDRQKKDGLRPNCKQCNTSIPRQPSDLPEGQKRCSKCQKVYPATLEYFHSEKGHKDGLTSHCAQCRTEHTTVYHLENREQYLAFKARYRRIHRAELLRKQREDYHRNPQLYQMRHANFIASHPEYIKVYNGKYFQTEHGKMLQRLGSQRRRARKRSISANLTIEQIQQKLKAQKYVCYYCFQKFEKRDGKYIYHLEHTIPLSRTEMQPRHDVNYVVLACPTCNLRKHDKLPHEFWEGGRLL